MVPFWHHGFYRQVNPMIRPVQHTIDTPYLVGPVHCYEVELEGELVLFDAGPPTMAGTSYMHKHIAMDRLRHIIITHCHIDHYGQAHWLAANSQAQVYLPRADHLGLTDIATKADKLKELLAGLGFDEAYLGQLQEIFKSGMLYPPMPLEYKIAETDIPEHLGITTIPCPGHSQSDLLYLVGDYVVTGDTILKGIFQSPLLDVDVENGGRFNNYYAYCETLVKLASFADKTILPGHRNNIDSVADTLSFYVEKLLIRVAQLLPFRHENNIMKLMEQLLGGRMTEVFHLYLKASEIVLMKDFLAEPERLGDALKRAGIFSRVERLYDAALA